MSDELDFDFDQVTPRMLLDFKTKTGVPLFSVVDEKGQVDLANMSEELVAGFMWLALRMSGRPEATWDEALDTPLARLGTPGEPETPDPT